MLCACALEGGGHHRVAQGFWQLPPLVGERIITAQGSFPSPPCSHLTEGFSLSCLCGLIARRAADVAPSKKFCLACHLGSSESPCGDGCFAPLSSASLFPLSALSAKLLVLLMRAGMRSEVLSVGPALLGVAIWLPPTRCRRWELLPLPDPDGAPARRSL